MRELKSSYFSEKDKARFWDKVEVRGENECWEWKKGKDKDGYGQVTLRKKPYRSHRLAWILTNGQIPDGKLVLHACDNPPCENPKHLFLGTHKENVEDRVEKIRSATGEKNAGCKLTKLKVLCIRKRYSEGETQVSIAECFGVSFQQVSRIVNREKWAHI